MTNRRILLLAVLGLIVPGLALWQVQPLGEEPMTGPAVPFGWWSLLLTQLLAGLPLVLLLSRAVRLSQAVALAVLLLGGMLCLVTVGLGAAVEPLLDRSGVGLVGRQLVRAGWCLGLQLPVVLSASCLVNTTAVESRKLSPLAVGLSVFVLLVLPGAHCVHLAQNSTQEANRLLEETRLARAMPLLNALAAVRSPFAVAGESPVGLRVQLSEQLRLFRAATQRPLPSRVPAQELFERARMLAMLDELESAAQLLEPLANQPATLPLLATIYQKMGQFDRSDRCLRQALQWLATQPDSVERRNQQRQCYDSLAFNAREARRFTDAEAVYREALEQLPTDQAHFHFQLGRHHHEGGRPLTALIHLRRAAELDADRYGHQATGLIQHIEQHTPGCLLRLSGQ
jgi:hypothetical protein